MLGTRTRQDISLTVAGELTERFEPKTVVSQPTHDGIRTFCVASAMAHDVHTLV